MLSRTAVVRVAMILATTLAGAAWLAYKGPVPVVRITTPLPEMAPLWYMLLAFPVRGMLVADLFDLWRARGLSLPTVELGLQIALIVALSSLGLGVRIPLSGHALLVAYFLFRQLWLRNVSPRQSRLEVWIAAVLRRGLAQAVLVGRSRNPAEGHRSGGPARRHQRVGRCPAWLNWRRG